MIERPQSDEPTREPGGVIERAEEQLHVDTRRQRTGTVRIVKTVEQREEVVDAPTMSEEVEVERVAVNRLVDQPQPVRQEGDVTVVPIHEEVLVVEKRLMLREEVRLVRRRTLGHAPQRVTLRREVARVERHPAGDPQGTRGSDPPPGDETPTGE